VQENLDIELSDLFPELFTRNMEYDQRLRERNILLLKEILDEDVTEKLQANLRYFKSLVRPKSFRGNQSVELKYDRDFEKTNNTLQTHTSKDVRAMTVKEYFGLVSFVKTKK
jgi:hypothetical protein